MRPPVALLAVLLMNGCGDAPAPRPPPAAPLAAPAPRSEREVIAPADLADQRAQVLEPRDTPLAVGASAPGFKGYPAKALTVIVFFRGEW